MHLLPRMMHRRGGLRVTLRGHQRRGGMLACGLARLEQPAVALDRLPLLVAVRLVGHDRRRMRSVLYEPSRLDLCYDSLHGLSVGDALGAQFFMVGRSLPELAAGRPPADPLGMDR
jgi:hypothetical protein